MTKDVLGSCFNFNCEYNISPDLMTPKITKSTYDSDKAKLTLEISTPHAEVIEVVEGAPVKSLADLIFEE